MSSPRRLTPSFHPESVLFVSNGFGEDTIASSIVEHLLAAVNPPRVIAMPLVGEGLAYARLGIELVGPRELMPSGGLILAGWSNILTDMRAGFWRMTAEQIATLKRLRGNLGALVAVGDTYPVILGSLFARQRVIMVGTAKSNYFCPYSSFEHAVFRRCTEIVFARDDTTAVTLSERGIRACWVGNAMMDSLGLTGQALPVSPDLSCVGLLPGSRKVAYRDLPVILDAVRELGAARNLGFMMTVPDSLAVEDVVACARAAGWNFTATSSGANDGVTGSLDGFHQHIMLVRGRFGDVVKHSAVIIGQAGTGNEQAAGMGKPVISFDSDGRRTPGWYRARQKGLLGDSISVVERCGSAIVREALDILGNGERYRTMQQAGYERMGPPGASAKIASYILERVRECTAAPLGINDRDSVVGDDKAVIA